MARRHPITREASDTRLASAAMYAKAPECRSSRLGDLRQSIYLVRDRDSELRTGWTEQRGDRAGHHRWGRGFLLDWLRQPRIAWLCHSEPFPSIMVQVVAYVVIVTPHREYNKRG